MKQASVKTRKTNAAQVEETSDGREVVTATFEEEGDMVDLEAQGQATEFISETEEGERSESDDEQFEYEQTNNNSTCKREGSVARRGALPQRSPAQNELEFEDETQILCWTDEEMKAQEEAEMQKFVDFMKKQGLVMVQQTPNLTVNVTQEQTQQRPTTTRPSNALNPSGGQGNKRDKRGMETDFVDNNSVITLYKMLLCLPVM